MTSRSARDQRSFLEKNGRYLLFLVVTLAMFGYVLWGLMNLQVYSSDVYGAQASQKRTKEIALRGSRGMITDIDSNILAKDEEIFNVTFYRDGSQNSKDEYAAFTKSIRQAIEIIERNGGKLAVTSKLERDPETGEWRFNFGSGVAEETLEEREKQWRNNHYMPKSSFPTADSCLNGTATRSGLRKIYQIGEDVDEELMLKIIAVYTEMQMNLFNSQSIVIAKDVAYETVIEIETQSIMLPGMEIAVGTKRVYPRSNLAAQIIGYTGAIYSNEKYLELKAKGYAYNDLIGRDGIEATMEDWLTQNSNMRQGYKKVERDRLGKITRVIESQEPEDGNNVKLTISVADQIVAERAIAKNVNNTRDIQDKKMADPSWVEKNKKTLEERDWEEAPLRLAEHGVLLVIDMQGRVKAMANYPTYDLNALVAGGKEAREIQSDPRNLLMNYSIHARGAPGSIFKMVTGLAALMEGKLEISETISDQGVFDKFEKDRSKAPKCWIAPNQRSKHQNQTIVQGIEHSCNYFFFELGARLFERDPRLMYKYSSLLGLTSTTGLDLLGEVRSVVGTQDTLYDPGRAIGSQDTSKPKIVFDRLKKHYKDYGTSRSINYDEERMNRCVKRLMDMAVNNPQGDEGITWISNMRTILMEELNMSREMVWSAAVISDPYIWLNEIKWGGSYTIQTAIGQGITVVTPAAVARYVAALANGGDVYNLMIVDSIISPEGEVISQRTPTLINRLEGAEDVFLPKIREGMKGVVDEGGTAEKYFKDFKYKSELSAKTGTAENSYLDLENHSWFVCFMPMEKPEIAVVSFIPNGLSGGEASLAARDYLEWYMNQRTLSTVESTLPGGNQLTP